MTSFVPIKYKIALLPIVLVCGISSFVYFYYPLQYQKGSIDVKMDQVKGMADLLSLSIGAALFSSDFEAITHILSRLREGNSLNYIGIYGTDNQLIVDFSQDSVSIELKAISGKEYINTGQFLFYNQPISYQTVNFGTLVIGYSLNDILDSLDRQKRATLGICAIIFVLGILLSLILSQYISHRLVLLKQATQRVAEGKPFKFAVKANDEIGELSVNFKEMVQKLATSQKDLKEYSVSLEEKNKELNNFAHIISHDLKSPLRGISSLVSFFEEDFRQYVKDDENKYLTLLKVRVDRMYNLIEGILQYSKIGKTNLEQEQINPKEVIDETLKLVIADKSVEIKCNVEQDPVKFNRVKLQQVFTNLIANAINHNSKKLKKVIVQSKVVKEFVQFTVSDNGPGIDQKHFQRIFKIFQTLPGDQDVKSTGIGLSIVERIVKESRGEIWLESDVKNGTKFHFTVLRAV